MSHEIEQAGDGRAAFYSLREDAWHRLGTVVEEAKSVDEALAIAHLDGWNVRKEPLYTEVGGQRIAVPGGFAVIRNNPFNREQIDVLATSGPVATHFQNEETAAFVDTLLAESGAVVETAGSLRDGREVFVTMKLPNTMQIGGQDAVDTYVAALNAHDGSKKFRTITTPVRVLCANTQALAEHQATGVIAVRHTPNAMKALVAKAREVLDLSFKYQGEFEAEANRMIETEMTNKQFDDIIRRLYPVDKSGGKRKQDSEQARQATLRDLFRESPTNESIRGTRWAGYQAVTEYIDHYRPLRGDDDTVNNRRAVQSLTGDGITARSKAFRMFAVKDRALAAV